MNPLRAESQLLADLAKAHADQCRTPAAYAMLSERVLSIDIGDSLRAELQLASSAKALRRMLLRDAERARGSIMRSPESGTFLDLAGGGPLAYTYERNLPGLSIEQRVTGLGDGPIPEGWRAASFVFSSGMAAIACVLDWTTYEFTRRHSRRPELRSLTEYFETRMVLELSRPRAAGVAMVHSLEQLFDASCDLMMFEPVLYNGDLEGETVDRVRGAWSSTKRHPQVVIIDSTLCGGQWPVAELLRGLGDSAPELVIDVRSGLKLDQQGLELANLGIVTCYASDASATSWWSETVSNLPVVRGVRGAALSAEAASVLTNGFVFDAEYHQRFIGPLFENNRRFAGELAGSGRGLFRVAHPGLRPDTAEIPAPFTVLQFADGTLEEYQALLGIVRAEAIRRKIPLALGGSFGFRGHRYEVIVPSVATRSCMFKVALGTRAGPGVDAVLDLFRELGEYPDVRSLTRRYPDAPPARFDLPARPTRGRHG
ncbi:hypothetical protein [Leifsonia soli]|uniref:PLP-dependent transferase n=1 Tax=Leifsonia soli TaxID=582665 RepID=A0A852SYF7_9MICO|nr:hypothetical protein [Leifsonia soli]NYD74218.1 hypothetical protein [Leifsonia soli]